MDTMFIEERPVIHILDDATHVSSAAFLKNHTSKEIWKYISRFWSMTYVGPTGFLLVY